MALVFKIAYCHLKINRRKKRYANESEFYDIALTMMEEGYEYGMNAFEHFPLDYDLFL